MTDWMRVCQSEDRVPKETRPKHGKSNRKFFGMGVLP